MLYSLARAALFRLPPETAHGVTLRTLDLSRGCGLSRLFPAPPDDPVELMGLRFANPVGLAAGMDKNGDYIDALAALGFGFLEIGTTTPRPQPGNPRPRVFRAPSARALINRLGFNNKGVDHLVGRVQRARYRGVLGINIGKNADTPVERALDDYVACLNKVHHVASYVALNVSSPNTERLRELQGPEALDRLLGGLQQRTRELNRSAGRRVPLLVKVAPDLDEGEIGAVARVLRSNEIDGLIATNTTLQRPVDLELPDEGGGLSGAPLFSISNRVVSAFHMELGGRIPIIGVGGLLSGEDSEARLRAGASLLQFYTGLVYAGPGLVREIAAAARDFRGR